MIKYYFHKHKRFIKVIIITILIIVCLIPVFISSLSAAADNIPEGYYSADNFLIFNRTSYPPNDNDPFYIIKRIPYTFSSSDDGYLGLVFEFEEPVLLSSFIGKSILLSADRSFVASTSDFRAYDVNGNVINNSRTNLVSHFSQSSNNGIYNVTIIINSLNVTDTLVSRVYYRFQLTPPLSNKTLLYAYSDVPFVPVIPPDPPSPSEWDYFSEFINGIIGGVILTFTSLFSLPSKILWAIIFGVPILNYLIDFFDNLLESLFPEATDLHELRPNGYVATSYEDNHPFENYSRWYYEHSGGFHW